ncbi:N-acetylmuramoyl-L-alanine amidase [Streptomyces sp. NPDC059513]|uniref:N-acetylmuramoyl-L-alanine amidase n=1 Tax=unclassified Streptomyces TaxID=2593676 RepID=UPI00368425E8
MTATQIKAALTKWGLNYKEYKDWSTHNRGSRGDGWGPVFGFMVHHTGSDSTDQRALLYNGISGLPGPLCHFGLAQDGTVHLVGWGRANHAGNGDPDVLKAVREESYGDRPPVDNESSVDGNARFYGVEIWYSGSHPMTDKQYAALRKLSAAICDFHGWSEKSVIAHGEWGSPGKWDIGYAPGKMYDMAKVRKDIKATLSGGVSEEKPKPVEPKPTKPVVKLSNLKYGLRNKDVEAVQKKLIAKGFKIPSGPTSFFGDQTKAAYSKYQKSLGYSGSDADGLPGKTSLEKLGFTVK